MRYRVLGRTGISVSEVGFGSHLNKFNVDNPEHRRKQIEVGLEQGINLFDIYEHSHQQFEPMSVALEPVKEEVIISLVTVWRRADEVLDEVDYALRVFKRDSIDLYRVVLGGHWEDSEQRLAALSKARDQGKIRSIGGVVHFPEHLLAALSKYPDTLEWMMVPASFCAPLVICEERELVLALRRHQVGLIAMKTMGAADEEGAYLFKLKPPGEEMETLRRKGLSLGKLALKYLLQSEVIASVLPTMNSLEEVLENVQASGDGPLTGDEQKFLQIYREEAERTLRQILPAGDYWITPWQA
jgi:aryl-alcohol dehydrogenase-like predicted oxidoreductase